MYTSDFKEAGMADAWNIMTISHYEKEILINHPFVALEFAYKPRVAVAALHVRSTAYVYV